MAILIGTGDMGTGDMDTGDPGTITTAGTGGDGEAHYSGWERSGENGLKHRSVRLARRTRPPCRMAVCSERLSPQPVRSRLTLLFPIRPFLGPALSPVLSVLLSHGFAIDRLSCSLIGGTSLIWRGFLITPIYCAQDSQAQEHEQYSCDHDVFLTSFRVLFPRFHLPSLVCKSHAGGEE